MQHRSYRFGAYSVLNVSDARYRFNARNPDNRGARARRRSVRASTEAATTAPLETISSASHHNGTSGAGASPGPSSFGGVSVSSCVISW